MPTEKHQEVPHCIESTVENLLTKSTEILRKNEEENFSQEFDTFLSITCTPMLQNSNQFRLQPLKSPCSQVSESFKEAMENRDTKSFLNEDNSSGTRDILITSTGTNDYITHMAVNPERVMLLKTDILEENTCDKNRIVLPELYIKHASLEYVSRISKLSKEKNDIVLDEMQIINGEAKHDMPSALKSELNKKNNMDDFRVVKFQSEDDQNIQCLNENSLVVNQILQDVINLIPFNNFCDEKRSLLDTNSPSDLQNIQTTHFGNFPNSQNKKTAQQLLQSLRKLKIEINFKEDALHKLQLVKIHSQKANLDEMHKLITKWKNVCKAALVELQKVAVMPDGSQPTMNLLLDHFKIDNKVIQ